MRPPSSSGDASYQSRKVALLPSVTSDGGSGTGMQVWPESRSPTGSGPDMSAKSDSAGSVVTLVRCDGACILSQQVYRTVVVSYTDVKLRDVVS